MLSASLKQSKKVGELLPASTSALTSTMTHGLRSLSILIRYSKQVGCGIGEKAATTSPASDLKISFLIRNFSLDPFFLTL